MKTLLKIKWENLMILLLLSSTIYGWFVYLKYATETKMLILALTSTFAFVIMIFGYKTIATFRKQVLKFW